MTPDRTCPSHPPSPARAETRPLPMRGPSDFPHVALGGAARLSFTARIEGAHPDRAASPSKKDGLASPSPTSSPPAPETILRPPSVP